MKRKKHHHKKKGFHPLKLLKHEVKALGHTIGKIVKHPRHHR